MEWRAAIYGRVSTGSEEQQESIKVQNEALHKYAEEHGYKVISKYFDEGYSGTGFERPGIKYLKEDIESAKINMILVKDLSRVGRNNSHTLLFLDYLSDHNVRLVAINDSYDSFEDQDDMVGIKTWMNELYSRELSRKIKFSLKHKKKAGEYLTAFAPFGYKKSTIVRNKLEKDYYAAKVVKDMFDLYISGLGFNSIAKILDEKGIPTPSYYGHYGRVSKKWDWTTVRRIITNPVYTGCSIQQRYRRRGFKSKSITAAPPSEWIVAEDTHEPVVDRGTYDMAQNILNKRKGTIKYRYGRQKPHLFNSFLYCGECGSPFYYKVDKHNKGIYRCGRYVKYGRKGCSSHLISEDELKNIILTDIKELVNNVIDIRSFTVDAVHEFMKKSSIQEELKLIKKQLDRNENKIKILYLDRLNGTIDDEMFLNYKAELELVNTNLKSEMDQKYQDIGQTNYEDYFTSVKKFISFEDGMERDILELLINKIVVYEDGNISVHYNFSSG